MKSNILLTLCLVLLAATAGAEMWKNLDEAHKLSKRPASDGYLRGKVVLVDRWGYRCPPCRRLLPRVEEIWQSFRRKPFVVLGGHCRGWGSAEEVQGLIRENNLTYPIYEDAGLAEREPSFNAIPFLYVVDETGRVLYKGHDERLATEVVVTALTDLEAPKSLEQFRTFLDWELENLPGRAYLRMKQFEKKYPKEVKAYAAKFAALKAIPDVKRLAELVNVARMLKDLRAFDPKKAKVQKAKVKARMESTLSKYESLKDSKEPRVVQEAKNALADVKWALAEIGEE